MDAIDVVRENVQRLLQRRRLSGTALARGLGHSSSWASNFLSGKKTVPIATVEEIAAFLEVPLWQLFTPPGAVYKSPPMVQGLADVGGNVPIGNGNNVREEAEQMPREYEASTDAMLKCLPPEEAQDIRADIARRVERYLPLREREGKTSAV